MMEFLIFVVGYRLARSCPSARATRAMLRMC